MVTDADVIKLSRVFATKQDVEKAKEAVLNHYDEKTDRILTAIDSFAGEIKDHRMKEAIHQQKHDEIEEKVEAIEKISVVAHQLRKDGD